MAKSKKSQSWSIDIALGVIVFMAAFFVVYSLLNTNPNAKASRLNEEASIIIKQVGSENALIRIIDNNEVNISKVNELKNISYNELKRRLRIESDFCIYFEDDKGYIVIINNSYKGIGSPSINLSGTPCSQK
ncbi:hypothetical protein HYX05_03975 [Candidatus Woesearchaeota archaeon]|nr:hypothetical protein [Candidatus Woesearchaeota archaeon]